jgi:hypothetical protein
LTGLAIVAVFLLLVGLMVARKLPALLAVPLMAIAMTAIAGTSPAGIGETIAHGVVQLAPVYATVIFGALLSRVVLQTGIAETIVTYAAEFGGDQPLVLALILCAAVALLFTSVTGLGAIIMIGTIVLPVMMTTGVPRTTAATLFLLAFGLGYILNIAQWKFYRDVFNVGQSDVQSYIYVLFAIDALVMIVYALVRARTTRDYATFAIAGDPPRKRTNPAALIAPVLPLVLFAGFRVDAIVAFLIAAVYGALVTRPRAIAATLAAAWIRGVEDVAPAVILMMGIGMLLVAAKTPEVQAAVTPVIAAVAPRTPLAYVIVFGLLSPLALYRGPLNPLGVGIGVYTVLAALHALAPVALVAAVMAVVQVQNVCDPTNTQNVWVANFTGVGVERITRLVLPYQVAVATLAVVCVVVFGRSLFAVPPFAPAAAAAAAATVSPAPSPTMPPALGATSASADTIAVVPLTPAAATAARMITAGVERSWAHGFHGLLVAHIDPDATCAVVPYASVMQVSTEQLGRVLDVGIVLTDCAGWTVDQWHEQGGDPAQLALAALFRVREWRNDRPAFATNVFERGIAYDPAVTTPTYFFTLFKTSDGYMRALARPGGPAWNAGLRTGDIIDKVDGRYWWEYGTYQTQLRAYDGKPHTFEVTRAGRHGIPVALGAPYVPVPG